MSKTKLIPDFSFEQQAHAQGYLRVAGVDEVGRGPLAGPVTAAAVVLDPTRIPDGLNDSKQLSAKRRAALLEEVLQHADVCVAHASVAEIDEHNILRASHIAMLRAVQGLKHPADFALIDGNMVPRGLNIPAETVVKGDARSVSIAAASIAAKIARPPCYGHPIVPPIWKVNETPKSDKKKKSKKEKKKRKADEMDDDEAPTNGGSEKKIKIKKGKKAKKE